MYWLHHTKLPKAFEKHSGDEQTKYYIVDILTSLYRKVKEMSQCVEINALDRDGAVMECEKMPYEVIVVEV